MFKVLLVVSAVLLVTADSAHADTGSSLCRDADKLNTTDINMDELANKQLNFVVATDSSDRIRSKVSFVDVGLHVVNSANSTYTCHFNIVYGNGSTETDNYVVSYKDGVIKSTVITDHKLILNRNLTWYVLVRTDNGAMLFYLCSDFPFPYDLRLIAVPSNNTLDEVTAYRQVPVNYVLSKQSLDKLLAVDASYCFRGQLEMVPYALQDMKQELK